MAVTAPRVAGKSVAGRRMPSLSLWRVNSMSLGSNAPPAGGGVQEEGDVAGRAGPRTGRGRSPCPGRSPSRPGRSWCPAASRLAASVLVAWDPGSTCPPGVGERAEGHPLDFGGDDRAVGGIVADRRRSPGRPSGRYDARRWRSGSAVGQDKKLVGRRAQRGDEVAFDRHVADARDARRRRAGRG